MSTIIHRSSLVFHGHNPPPELAYVTIEHGVRRVVTWDDVMRARRERQARRLEEKRRVPYPRRACRVWVAYFDQSFFGGWQAFVEDFRGRKGSVWVDRGRGLVPTLMRTFPLTLPLGRDERDRFADWKEAFAREYRRGTHHGRPRGCAFVWWDGREMTPVGPPTLPPAPVAPAAETRRVAGGRRKG